MSATGSLVRTPSHSSRNTLSQRTTTGNALTTTSSTPAKLSVTPQKGANTTPSSNTPGSQQKPLPRLPQQQPSPASSTPGRWQHPRINEVMKRRDRTKFDGDNTRLVAKHAVLLASSFVIPALLQPYVPRSWAVVAGSFWPMVVFWIIRLNFLVTIGLTCLPLIRKEDACEDIPLTPAQRQLLGLPPMTRPMTPQEKDQWVTPPRYSRSATPRSATSIQANAPDSPLSGRDVLLDSSSRSLPSGSPFSQSPQLRSGGERRRLSYTSNRSSPLSISEFDAAGNIGTPTKGARASVGLNNKWLYEKGRGSPRLSGVFS